MSGGVRLDADVAAKAREFGVASLGFSVRGGTDINGIGIGIHIAFAGRDPMLPFVEVDAAVGIGPPGMVSHGGIGLMSGGLTTGPRLVLPIADWFCTTIRSGIAYTGSRFENPFGIDEVKLPLLTGVRFRTQSGFLATIEAGAAYSWRSNHTQGFVPMLSVGLGFGY